MKKNIFACFAAFVILAGCKNPINDGAKNDGIEEGGFITGENITPGSNIVEKEWEGLIAVKALESGIYFEYKLPMYFSTPFFVKIASGDVTFQREYQNAYSPIGYFVFPFVEAEKEYEFTVSCGYSYGGDSIYNDKVTVTAIGGLGDIEFEKTPVLSFEKNDAEDCIVKLSDFPVVKNNVKNDVLIDLVNTIDWCSTERMKKTEFNFFKENAQNWYTAAKAKGSFSGKEFSIICNSYISIPDVNGYFIKRIGTVSGKNTGEIIKIKKYYGDKNKHLLKDFYLQFDGPEEEIIDFGATVYEVPRSYSVKLQEDSNKKLLEKLEVTEWGYAAYDSEEKEIIYDSMFSMYEPVSYTPVSGDRYSYPPSNGEICSEVIIYPRSFRIRGNVEVHRGNGLVEYLEGVEIYSGGKYNSGISLYNKLSPSYLGPEYEYLGWFIDKDCKGELNETYIMESEGNLTLYEGWRKR